MNKRHMALVLKEPDCGLVHHARSADHTPTGHHRAAKEEAGSSASGRRRSSQQEANLEPSLRNQPESALQRQWEETGSGGFPTEGWEDSRGWEGDWNAGESLPGKSTGHTALPGHEARAWECGAGGRRGGSHGSGRGTRDAGPGARPFRVTAAQPSGVGRRRPGTRGQQAVSGASTHPRVPLLSRAPQPAFLRPTLPRPRELPLALFVAPPLGMSAPKGSRVTGREPDPASSSLNP